MFQYAAAIYQVAVTGLPEPTIDHAIIMCKFARDILTQFNQLSSQLEIILGPDTGDLAIRVGIHSGPVTAGKRVKRACLKFIFPDSC